MCGCEFCGLCWYCAYSIILVCQLDSSLSLVVSRNESVSNRVKGRIDVLRIGVLCDVVKFGVKAIKATLGCCC